MPSLTVALGVGRVGFLVPSGCLVTLQVNFSSVPSATLVSPCSSAVLASPCLPSAGSQRRFDTPRRTLAVNLWVCSVWVVCFFWVGVLSGMTTSSPG